ncbi:Ig-like domain-containing protein [Terrimonas sp. NA20]|uniref:Ig-like domain-containing protein n=1 Tax=Terrimonas ginsenosidimutans TaxID=2908004 RepID=A0ABS9KZM6_9BACT|nr:Ig-like domain-containing protein [Terrimonas ginsenosidimutans]MCG2617745.1 Ig-like domain-containing protein [Terrimonas ginsenosidimutans]
MKKLNIVISLLLLVSAACSANGFTDSTKAKAVNPGEVAFRSFPSIDQAVREFTFQPESGFPQSFFDEVNGDPKSEELKSKARASLAEVESANSFVDILTPSDLNQLPIGMKKKVGNSVLTIAVSSAVFTSRYAELTVFAKLTIPQEPKEIYFGITGLKLSKRGGIIGAGKLALLGNLNVPINNGNAALVLKGGFDTQTGLPLDQTYLSIDCNGFKELKISADVQFPRSLFIPVDNNGQVIASGFVKGSFATLVSDWNNILADVSFANKFQIANLKGIDIGISNAIFDFSDTQNGNVVYPAGYREKYVSQTNPETWRGIYAKDITVTLPNAFKDKSTGQKITFGVNDLLIDNNGVSGKFYAENILNFQKGSASGWPLSVDSIRIGIEANSLRSAGFGGSIGLPISQSENSRKLGYSAYISASGDYVCSVRSKDTLGFDFLQARTTLLPNSYVLLKGNSDQLEAEAMLNGYMNIGLKRMNAADAEATGNQKGEFKDIEFQQLHLKSTAPYISIGHFGYNGAVKLANFPVFVDNINLTAQNSEARLGFNVNLNLQNGKITGSTGVTLVAKMNPQTEDHWKFDKVEVNEVAINADFGAFQLEGHVQFMNNDPVFNDGFRGSLAVKMPTLNGLEINAAAVFGSGNYRYWFFDAMTKIPGGIPVAPAVVVNGIGGGAFYNMKRVSGNTAQLPTAYDYVPDNTAGLGLRASLLFSAVKEDVAKGRASLEIGFNSGGGLRYMGIYGYMHLLSSDLFNPASGLLTELKQDLDNIEQKLNASPLTDAMIATKMYQPTEAAKTTITPVSGKTPGTSGLSAYVGIMCDFQNSTFSANFDVYLNVGGGVLKGIGANNRAGGAVFYIGPDKWFLHAGTPTNRMGVQIGVGPLNIRTTSYFMIGHDIPAFPGAPQEVTSLLKDGQVYQNNINPFQLQLGQGMAFGASVSVNTGDMRLLFLYAKFQAGIGFDVMFTKGLMCPNRSEIGINGWYAQGQAYAYLAGEAGVQIKLGFIKKKIKIIKGSAACLLQAKLPNPTWVGGEFMIRVEVLGGLIRANLGLKMSFGEQCQLESTNEGGSDYDNFKIVSSITPAPNATKVTVIARPQVNFVIKPGKLFELYTDEGEERLMPKMEYAQLIDSITGQVVETSLKYSSDTSSVTLIPSSILKANTKYKVKAYFTYQQFKNGIWSVLSENGTKVDELDEQSFTTGNEIDTIPNSAIVHMYPFHGQHYYFYGENVPGNVNMDQNYSNFGVYDNWKVYFRNQQGQTIDSTGASFGGNKFTFTRSDKLQPESNYTYEMWGFKNDGSKIMTKPVIKVAFRTSKFATLAAKIQSLNVTQGVIGRLSSDVINLQADLQPFEPFDIQELDSTTYASSALIIGTADVANDPFYTQTIQPLIYPTVPFTAPYSVSNATPHAFPITRTGKLAQIGVPPIHAITPLDFYIERMGVSQYDEFISRRFPFAYDLPKFYNQDMRSLQAQMLNHYLNIYTPPPTNPHPVRDCGYVDPYDPYGYNNYGYNQSLYFECSGDGYNEDLSEAQLSQIPGEVYNIIASPFPFLRKGNYPVIFKLNLPGNPAGASSAVFIYKNPID